MTRPKGCLSCQAQAKAAKTHLLGLVEEKKLRISGEGPEVSRHHSFCRVGVGTELHHSFQSKVTCEGALGHLVCFSVDAGKSLLNDASGSLELIEWANSSALHRRDDVLVEYVNHAQSL